MQSEAAVHIVDDDKAFRRSLCLLMASVGLPAREYASAQEFLDVLEPSLPGCVILDVRMPGMSGMELYEILRGRKVPMPVIMMSGYGDIPMAVRAMKAGVQDFVEKPFDDEMLLDRVRICLRKSEEIKKEISESEENAARLAQLTPREREVMELLVAGKTNKVIAADLGISIKTIELHRARVMKKLSAGSIAEVVRIALQARSA